MATNLKNISNLWKSSCLNPRGLWLPNLACSFFLVGLYQVLPNYSPGVIFNPKSRFTWAQIGQTLLMVIVTGFIALSLFDHCLTRNQSGFERILCGIHVQGTLGALLTHSHTTTPCDAPGKQAF